MTIASSSPSSNHHSSPPNTKSSSRNLNHHRNTNEASTKSSLSDNTESAETSNSASPTSVVGVNMVTNNSNKELPNDKDASLDSVVRTLLPKNQQEYSLSDIRSSILQVTVDVGALMAVLLEAYASNSSDSESSSNTTTRTKLASQVRRLVQSLLQTANHLHLSLHQSVLQKLELNRRKYPVHLCKVRIMNL